MPTALREDRFTKAQRLLDERRICPVIGRPGDYIARGDSRDADGRRKRYEVSVPAVWCSCPYRRRGPWDWCSHLIAAYALYEGISVEELLAKGKK